MILIGLTGSIGMGKSTVAAMFRKAGVPVFDADAAVHRLQGPEGLLLPEIEAAFPGTTGSAGVDRAALGKIVFDDRTAMRRLERIVHPAVFAMRRDFLRRHSASPVLIDDIPLLFETRSERRLDAVVVVSAPSWMQRERVLARPGMTQAKLSHILSLQVPDPVKRRRAEFVIRTGTSLIETRAQVARLLACLRRRGIRYCRHA